jgi:hypothetical protein
LSRGKVVLLGNDELHRKLDGIKHHLGQLIADSLMVGAMPMNDRWKENIYSYPLVKTGAYARSVHVELVSQSMTGAEVMVGTNIVDPPYPYFLEFGTWAITPKGVARAALDATWGDVQRESQRAFEFLLGRYI